MAVVLSSIFFGCRIALAGEIIDISEMSGVDNNISNGDVSGEQISTIDNVYGKDKSVSQYAYNEDKPDYAANYAQQLTREQVIALLIVTTGKTREEIEDGYYGPTNLYGNITYNANEQISSSFAPLYLKNTY